MTEQQKATLNLQKNNKKSGLTCMTVSEIS